MFGFVQRHRERREANRIRKHPVVVAALGELERRLSDRDSLLDRVTADQKEFDGAAILEVASQIIHADVP